MRTQDEIVTAMRAMIANDRPMDGEYAVLLPCLDWQHARAFLKPEATEEAWTTDELTLDAAAVFADAVRALRGAWERVEEHDDAAVERLVNNVRGYVWLLGSDADAAAYDDRSDVPFGAPKFRWAAQTFALPMPVGIAQERMSEGRPCSDLCTRGCR